jgi:hypothetical protein
MKTFKNALMIVFIVMISSCGSRNVKFPISSIVPAATISATKKIDKQKNISLEITTKNLASADRLDPPGNNYSIWIVTTEYGIKNVGQLNVDNAKKATFKTVTPFDFGEVFITVENQGNLQYHRGVEIARTKL